MKLAFGASLILAVIPSIVVAIPSLTARACGNDDATCAELLNACTSEAGDPSALPNPWSKKSCIAAVACSGIKPFGAHAHCVGRDMPAPATVPSLDYNVYASIVGSCAWSEGGCPITPQNFVDLIYGSVQSNWPASPAFILEHYWSPIAQWAVPGSSPPTNASIPYKNLDDWLKYSVVPKPPVEPTTTVF